MDYQDLCAALEKLNLGGEEWRSEAAKVRYAQPLIEQAIDTGIKREAIHEALQGAGADLSYQGFISALQRARNKNANGVKRVDSRGETEPEKQPKAKNDLANEFINKVKKSPLGKGNK